MHYNIDKLIQEYRSKERGNSGLYYDDMKRLLEIAKNPINTKLNDMLFDGINCAFMVGYMAGYHKAIKELKRVNNCKG